MPLVAVREQLLRIYFSVLLLFDPERVDLACMPFASLLLPEVRFLEASLLFEAVLLVLDVLPSSFIINRFNLQSERLALING